MNKLIILLICIFFIPGKASADFGDGPGEFIFPTGITLDQKGNIYITEAGSDRVQKLDENQQWVDGWGRFGKDSLGFDDPSALAFGPDGHLYIVDSGNRRIVVYDTTGDRTREILLPDSCKPYGIAFWMDFFYVSDRRNNTILLFNENRNLISSLGQTGSREGEFFQPKGLAVDSKGRLYVADSGNNRIQVFSPEGIFLKSWGGYGDGDGEFDNPVGICIGPEGQILVTDSGNDRFEEFSADGLFNSYGGGQGTEPGQFLNPTGITLDGKGTLYIVDTDNHRVQVFNAQ